jgi:phosphoserine phosphatase
LIRFLVVFDVDSTLIEDEAIELLADYAGRRELVAQITDRAMRGELDFKSSLMERVATLRDLPSTVLSEVSQKLQITTGAKELISEIHRRGGVAAAVSGGFMQLLRPITEQLALDRVLANTLEIAAEKLTGSLSGKIIDEWTKASFLVSLAKELDLPLSKTIAIGDGANDIQMIETAGLGVAFCAKPKLKEVSDLVLDVRNLAQLISVLP